MREERTDALSPHEERTHAFTCFNTLASGQEIPFGRRFVPLIDFQLPSDSRSPDTRASSKILRGSRRPKFETCAIR